jgi:hypothetical protein
VNFSSLATSKSDDWVDSVVILLFSFAVDAHKLECLPPPDKLSALNYSAMSQIVQAKILDCTGRKRRAALLKFSRERIFTLR